MTEIEKEYYAEAEKLMRDSAERLVKSLEELAKGLKKADLSFQEMNKALTPKKKKDFDHRFR